MDYFREAEPVWNRGAVFIGLLALGLTSAVELGSESLTLQSYYPSPLGIYSQLTSTSNTALARDGGTVVIGNTAAPSTTLTVNGNQYDTGDIASNGNLIANANVLAGNYVQAPNVVATQSLWAGPSTWPPTGPVYAGDVYVNSLGNWLSALRPIVCSASRSSAQFTGAGFFVYFTAAECGGRLPDSTYVGTVRHASMCNGMISANVYESPPSMSFAAYYNSWSSPTWTVCNWPNGQGVDASAVYFKR